jgi:hypothetical protein
MIHRPGRSVSVSGGGPSEAESNFDNCELMLVTVVVFKFSIEEATRESRHVKPFCSIEAHVFE